jgi:hypothetical protein
METAKLPLDILQKVERRWSERLAQAASRPAAPVKAADTTDGHPDSLVSGEKPIDVAGNQPH